MPAETKDGVKVANPPEIIIRSPKIWIETSFDGSVKGGNFSLGAMYLHFQYVGKAPMVIYAFSMDFLVILVLTRISETEFVITSNMFNFNFPPGTSWQRDTGTVMAAFINYNIICPFAISIPLVYGGPYPVIFNGLVTIPK